MAASEICAVILIKIVFWLCAGLIAYTYVGYHLVLLALRYVVPTRRPAPGRAVACVPPVSVIVAAYNEERVIRRRIENLLALDYPRERLEILVASDGSTDGTVPAAAQYAGQGVLVLDLPRRGKALAHNAAVARSSGEVVVFTDADSEFDPPFLKAITAPLADGRVGCVVGNLSWKHQRSGNAVLKGWYWRIETSLRDLEARLGIFAAGTGAGMAVRRALWRPMLSALDDTDTVTPLHVVLQGFRVALARDALLSDETFSSAGSEFQAKVRGVSKTVDMLARHWGISGCVGHPVITWRIVSHHLLRWVSPFVAAAFLISSIMLWRAGPIYASAAACELVLLLLLAVGYVAERKQTYVAVASPLYSFAAVNAGMGVGLLKALRRTAKGTWETQ